MGTMNLVLVLMVLLCGRICMADANVVLIGDNVTLSFEDIEASFGEFNSSGFFVLWLICQDFGERRGICVLGL